MSTLVRSAIFAAAVLAGLSAVEARHYYLEDNNRPLSSYDNNPDDVRSFFEMLQRTNS